MTTTFLRMSDPVAWLRRSASRPLFMLAAAAFASGVIIRLMLATERPLWLDEAFTGAIAAESTLGGVLRQTLLDVNAPGYYVVAHFWTAVFSLSNGSLRMPSLLFGLAAPLLCLVRTPGLAWRAQLLWFASVALWEMACAYSNEARCYSLLYFCVIANTLAFVRLVVTPRLGAAFLWGLASATMILFHYIPIVLVASQSVILLWLLRGRVFALWPAAIPLIPTAIWFLAHLSRIREFTQKDVAWYPYLTVGDLPAVLTAIFGILPFLCLAFLGAVLIFERNDTPSATCGDNEPVSGAAPWLAAAAGLGAMAVFVVMGFIRPSFTQRYLFAFAPAFLLLLPLVCERVAARLPHATAICLALIVANGWHVIFVDDEKRHFEYESGARFLMDAGVRDVAFLWDNPNNQAEAPEQMAKVGGFFFDRARANVVTTPVRLSLDADPNIELARLAISPKSGFIWLYDVNIRHTAAARYLPRLLELSQDFDCRQSGLIMKSQLLIGALSCIRKGDT